MPVMRNQRHAERVQLVGQSVVGDRQHAGVAENSLVRTGGRRVAFVGRLHIGRQEFPRRGQPREEPSGDSRGTGIAVVTGFCIQIVAGEAQSASDLLFEAALDPVQRAAQVEGRVVGGQFRRAEVAREEHRPQRLDDVDHDIGCRPAQPPASGL